MSASHQWPGRLAFAIRLLPSRLANTLAHVAWMSPVVRKVLASPEIHDPQPPGVGSEHDDSASRVGRPPDAAHASV